jgi:pyruvate/2-oxoglutarate/acetoin dehydrogenase E1 component
MKMYDAKKEDTAAAEKTAIRVAVGTAQRNLRPIDELQ